MTYMGDGSTTIGLLLPKWWDDLKSSWSGFNSPKVSDYVATPSRPSPTAPNSALVAPYQVSQQDIWDAEFNALVNWTDESRLAMSQARVNQATREQNSGIGLGVWIALGVVGLVLVVRR